jgi:hypothetical protein
MEGLEGLRLFSLNLQEMKKFVSHEEKFMKNPFHPSNPSRLIGD